MHAKSMADSGVPDDLGRSLVTPPPFAPSTVAATLLDEGAPPPRVERRRHQMGDAVKDRGGCVRLRGELVHDARVHYAATGGVNAPAWLRVTLALPGGQCVFAAEDIGTDPAAHMAADRRAGQLRRGTTCTVWGESLTPHLQHGETVLQVMRPTILLDDVPDHTGTAG